MTLFKVVIHSNSAFNELEFQNPIQHMLIILIRIKGVLSMRSEWKFWVYILSSVSGTLYVGVTNNIDKRIWEHKSGLIEGFSKKYKCTRLVYYESFDDVRVAISREKQLKRWRREKKVELIEGLNPHRNDFSENWGSRMVFPQESIREFREKAEDGN